MHTSHVCVTLTSRIYFLLILAQGKKAAPEWQGTSVVTSVLGWVLLGLHLFVGTLELPKFRSCCCCCCCPFIVSAFKRAEPQAPSLHEEVPRALTRATKVPLQACNGKLGGRKWEWTSLLQKLVIYASGLQTPTLIKYDLQELWLTSPSHGPKAVLMHFWPREGCPTTHCLSDSFMTLYKSNGKFATPS